jgi:protein tyrosine/serine phosphatase
MTGQKLSDKISVLHVSDGVAKTARAAILRDEFYRAQSFRSSEHQRFLQLKNTHTPPLNFT